MRPAANTTTATSMRRTTPTNPAALAWALVLGHEARVSGDDEREVREMAESNFHGRMMNIPTDRRKLMDASTEACDRPRVYEYGHRDARHAAAEIANEADARIAALEAQLAAAQERERIFRAEADYYLAYIYRGIFEDERERGEFEDDAIRIANNIMASLKQSALAAAQTDREVRPVRAAVSLRG